MKNCLRNRIRILDGSESDLSRLFAKLEHQVLDAIEYEAQHMEGTLQKKPSNWDESCGYKGGRAAATL